MNEKSTNQEDIAEAVSNSQTHVKEIENYIDDSLTKYFYEHQGGNSGL